MLPFERSVKHRAYHRVIADPEREMFVSSGRYGRFDCDETCVRAVFERREVTQCLRGRIVENAGVTGTLLNSHSKQAGKRASTQEAPSPCMCSKTDSVGLPMLPVSESAQVKRYFSSGRPGSEL